MIKVSIRSVFILMNKRKSDDILDDDIKVDVLMNNYNFQE